MIMSYFLESNINNINSEMEGGGKKIRYCFDFQDITEDFSSYLLETKWQMEEILIGNYNHNYFLFEKFFGHGRNTLFL